MSHTADTSDLYDTETISNGYSSQKSCGHPILQIATPENIVSAENIMLLTSYRAKREACKA